MVNVITSLHSRDNQWLNIWGRVTKIKAHKPSTVYCKTRVSDMVKNMEVYCKETLIFCGWKR